MISPDPITIRVEKLRFLVEEMELAFALSRAAPDAWEGRMLARHVLVRACDFIDHARALRKPLKAYGSVKAYNELKETYAGWFEEYFATARDRLGAHVQDLDFGRRIELWNDIETSKADVFVDGAREIYRHLSAFGLPGYAAHRAPMELSDPAFQKLLDGFRASGPGAGVEVSSDPLALTRPQTVAMLNTHPLHARAGQLNLIARWIRRERGETERFGAFLRVVRILRARLLTDVVSFADCLVTRPVAATAPQYMKGLDELLRDDGHPSAALASLTTAFRFSEVLDRLRPLRNSFAAHLETDESTPLAALLQAFDALDWANVAAAFDTLFAAFRSACGESLVLRTHLVEGQTLTGVIARPPRDLAPYDPAAPPPPTPQLPAPLGARTADDYRRAVDRWLSGGDAMRAEAARFLADGEAFTLIHDLGGGQRFDAHRFTPAHGVVLDLMKTQAQPVVLGLLDLLAQQRSGYRERAAEVVLRFIEAVPAEARRVAPQLNWTLGELASWDANRHAAHLRRQARSERPWPARREAIIGLCKAFVRTEGIRRLNDRRDLLDYDRDLAPLVSDLAVVRELEVMLVVASAFCDALSLYRKPFEAELAGIVRRVQKLSERLLSRQGRADRAPVVEKLLVSDDFVGVVLLLAEGASSAITQSLLGLVRDGTVTPAHHDQAGRHLVGCLWRANDRAGALQVAERLATRNPTEAAGQLLRLEILAELRRDLDIVRRESARLRSDFVLTAADEARLSALDAELATHAPAA